VMPILIALGRNRRYAEVVESFDQHLQGELDLMRGFLRAPDGAAEWVARESNPEPTDRWSVAPEIGPERGVRFPLSGEAQAA
jgi:hypothetical protein